MIDGMANHATRVRRHIERLGLEKVETFIDSCLCLENLIDPMSPFIVRRSSDQQADDKILDTAKEVPRLKAKEYMEGFINPPEYIETQRR
ncbi:SpoVR family protein, partial [Escherichia coli]|uniref:SpoVR family protein n=1 Tax=Escherichia coli TaxID=562 RepID=UPI0028DE6EE2